jgi:hypothetical protein
MTFIKWHCGMTGQQGRGLCCIMRMKLYVEVQFGTCNSHDGETWGCKFGIDSNFFSSIIKAQGLKVILCKGLPTFQCGQNFPFLSCLLLITYNLGVICSQKFRELNKSCITYRIHQEEHWKLLISLSLHCTYFKMRTLSFILSHTNLDSLHQNSIA